MAQLTKLDHKAIDEGLAIRKAPRRIGTTGQKARGKNKLLRRETEFEDLFDGPIVISREIILKGYHKDAA